MTITLQAVNELIASLEAAGELSIKETKVMALAKAYQQLAAENVQARERHRFIRALAISILEHSGGRHDWRGAMEDASDLVKTVDEIYSKTPATDRIVAEAEARGVERAIAHLEKKFSNIGVQIMNLQWLADSLREGADK